MVLGSGQKAFLANLFPGQEALFDQTAMLPFSFDSSRLSGPPLAVLRPRSVGQIKALLEFASEEKIPVYPRGSGTNMVGASVPARPGLVLSTLFMNRIVEISADDFVAVVEPGVLTAELQKQVEARGLFFPPDPASAKLSTIGGNVATGAGGLRAVRYGGTRDYVLGLEAVLASGQIIHTGGRVHKNAVGLDLTSLLVGSEGSLAVISQIILKLLPKPPASASVLAAYADLDSALWAGQAVLRAGFLPSAIELMPGEVLDCLVGMGRPLPWPASTRAVLLFRLEGAEKSLLQDLADFEAVLAATAPLGLLRGEGSAENELWEPRRMINPASFLLKPDKLSSDIVIPRGALKTAFAGLDRIRKEYKQNILAFGHMGDGNIHVNVMYNASDPQENALARQARDAVLEMTLELKGSISGEHGVGLAKAPWMARQIGPSEERLMAGIKQVFDPTDILNPGKWLRPSAG